MDSMGKAYGLTGSSADLEKVAKCPQAENSDI